MKELKKKLIPLFFHIYLINYTQFLISARKLQMKVKSNTCHKTLNTVMENLTELFGSGLLLHIVVSDVNSACLSPGVLKEMEIKQQLVLTEVNTTGLINDILVERPNVYILITSDCSAIDQIQKGISIIMNYTQAWNPGAKFLLLIISTNCFKEINYEFVMNTFNYLWKRNIFRVALVSLESNKDQLTLFSSSPYSSTYKTCKEITDPAQLQEVTLSDIKLNNLKIVGYNYETPKTYLGCPLIAYTFPLPPYTVVDMAQNDTLLNPKYKMGIEIELVSLLAVEYNISLDLNTAKYYLQNNGWSYKLLNGTFVGMFEDIIDYKIDLAFAGTIPSCSRYYRVGHSYTQLFNSMSWYVPGGEVMSSWHMIISAFTTSSWILLITACVSFPVLYKVLSRPSFIPLPEPAILIMWRTLLGVSTHWTPHSTHLRLLLYSWSVFCLHITIMFTTRLLSLLADRPVEAGVTTIQDLQKSGLRTCMSQLYREYYLNRTESYIKMIVDAAIICNNVENVVQHFLDYKNFSILAKDDFMTFLIALEKVNVHKLDQKFITYPVTMIVTKGSFFKAALETLIMRVHSAGLFQKWLYNAHEDSNDTFIPSPKNRTKKFLLHFEDFIWLLMLLLIGHGAALSIFIIEILSYKF